MTRRETEQWIQSSYDGELPAELEEELAELLRNSAEARDAWCDYALLQGDLKRQAGQHLTRPGSIPPSTAYATARQKRRQVVGSLAAAAAVLALGALILTAVFVHPGSSRVACSSSSGSLLFLDGQPFEDTHLTRDEPLEIRQGVVRLEFPNGVLGIIEGPANVEIDSDSEVRFAGGRAHFHVPANAVGFTVLGETMDVIDRGTDFGVDFRDPDRASVSVFKGRVEVKAHKGHQQTLMLSAGDSVRLTPVGRFESRSGAESYLTTLPDQLPECLLDFDRPEGDSFTLEGSLADGASLTGKSKFAARIVSEDPSAVEPVKGVVGSALRFVGDAELVTDWPGLHGNAPRTVAVWFRLEPGGDYRSAPPLALWGVPGGSLNHKFKLAVITERDGRNYARVSFGRWYANGITRISDDGWHHLAVVWDGTLDDDRPSIRLYLDGQPEDLSFESASRGDSFGTETLDDSSLPLTIGRYELPMGAGHRYFRGTIDELRIIAGALTAEQVQELQSRDR